MKVLAIVPARGGSKGVPRKNLHLVHGKPLISWTIECAVAVPRIDRIIVSSDDEAILAIARNHLGVHGLRRQAALAGDESSIVPVVAHALAAAEHQQNILYDAIVLLQATAPLREPFHVEEALAALVDGVSAVISVCAVRDTHPARMYGMDQRGVLSPLAPELEGSRRQDLPPVYHRNGSIYIVRREAFIAQSAVMAKPAVGYPMDDRYSLNIDEPRDMLIADALVAAWQKGQL